MKRRLAVLGTAIMAAAAITACGGKDTKTTAAAEVVTGADTAGETEEPGTEDAGAASDAEAPKDSLAADSGSQEAALLEEAEDVSHAGAELEQSEIKPFAEKVQKAVADKDMEALAGLCAYPVYVSLGEGQGEEIADEAAFMKMDADRIFTESLLKEIADTDTDTLEQFGAGVIMGGENSIIFNNVDGQAAITGINLN
ncbi:MULTISPECIES: hypothetical protein [unclassified Clostridium]|uniref:hypothetical protein n=1 Tax=unclassified Clostridium TaxID=2614128 RepID=UPI00110746B7|nr:MULTISPECIES: hypothetical protein [unclassified Clostridium]